MNDYDYIEHLQNRESHGDFKMSKSIHQGFSGGVVWSVLALFLSFSFTTQAESATDQEMEEVIVTGSAIRGTPIDAESPVTIMDRDSLEKEGAPSIVDMVRRISASSGIDGETNQFQSNASEGVANVNIRGLGAARTLVLLNGKRQTYVPFQLPAGRFVDINNMPPIGIERVEVLKEGAAATYGSDAIAGVVNFITRSKFEGLQFSAGYKDIQDSDGDTSLGIIFGKDFGTIHWVTSLGIQERSKVQLRDRDFATQPYAQNPEGGFSSIGNPGVIFLPSSVPVAVALYNTPFYALLGGFGGVKDPNCELLGGVDQSLFCRFRYTDYDNLVEKEKRFQLFTEANGELGDMGFHVELLYAENDTPEWETSPSYPPQALFGDVQVFAGDHPGLVDMAAKYPGVYDAYTSSTGGTGGAFYGRIAGAGSTGPRVSERFYETMRLMGTLNGDFDNGNSWDLGVTYATTEGRLGGVDAQIGRTKLAFLGYGGSNCAGDLDTSGNLVTNGAVAGAGGCMYYNPFSNAIEKSHAALTNGVLNPDYDPLLANDPELMRWIDQESITKAEATLIVVDAAVQGELFDGQAAWAAGYQYREFETISNPSNLTNLNINPCAYVGQTDCATRTGLRSFLSGGRPVDEDREVHSLFFETALHISDDLDIQLAARYEDYGNDSTTFDPKLAVRYRFSDWLTLRSSVQTTFRGPSIDNTNPNRVTALSYVGQAAAFKAIDYIGNPDLDPESAFTYNFGFVITPLDELTMTVDYWFYDFDNPIVAESFNDLINAYAAGGARKEAVQSQIYCQGGLNDGSCVASAVERIENYIINGPAVKTSGIDIFIEYEMEAGPGMMTFGADFSHVIQYKVDDFEKNGVLIASGYDGAGYLNAGRGIRPLPDLKGRLRAEYNWDNQNFLLYMNYINSYDDERVAAEDAVILAATGSTQREIDEQITFDFHYQIYLGAEDNSKLTFSVLNLTDEEPPFARVDLNYDAYTHNPLGRMIKVGFEYTL